MRDMLPDEVALRDWAMAQILAVYRRHGFVRIEQGGSQMGHTCASRTVTNENAAMAVQMLG